MSIHLRASIFLDHSISYSVYLHLPDYLSALANNRFCFCKNLQYIGQSDWRLPKIEEYELFKGVVAGLKRQILFALLSLVITLCLLLIFVFA